MPSLIEVLVPRICLVIESATCEVFWSLWCILYAKYSVDQVKLPIKTFVIDSRDKTVQSRISYLNTMSRAVDLLELALQQQQAPWVARVLVFTGYWFVWLVRLVSLLPQCCCETRPHRTCFPFRPNSRPNYAQSHYSNRTQSHRKWHASLTHYVS